MKPLKNYTTKIPANKTIAAIEDLLAQFGVTDIWKQYDDGEVISLNFRMNTEFGNIPFQLPLKVKEIYRVLKEQKAAGRLKGLPKNKLDNLDHARRVGWRQLYDWVDAQLTMVQLNQVKVEEVFLPYVYDVKEDKRYFQKLEANHYAGLLGDGMGEQR